MAGVPGCSTTGSGSGSAQNSVACFFLFFLAFLLVGAGSKEDTSCGFGSEMGSSLGVCSSPIGNVSGSCSAGRAVSNSGVGGCSAEVISRVDSLASEVGRKA